MRATSLLRILLALQDTIVDGFDFDEEGIIVDVRPSWRIGRCGDCQCKAKAYDSRERMWRHLDLGGIKCRLRYELRRVSCPKCGVVVEAVPWAQSGSWFTKPFEDHTAYLAQKNDKTTVTKLMRIGWATVGNIIKRFVGRQRGDVDRLDGLRLIGVDELSYRRHHEYVTVVVDHERAAVVWAAPGKSADTLKQFFGLLGPERCSRLEAVTLDMSKAYIKAVTEASPAAKLIFDRFHVQRLAQEAVDEVRRDEVRNAAPKDKKALKKTRFALLKNPWNLTTAETEKLTQLQQTNQRIYRAYLLKEAFASVLDLPDIELAEAKLEEWLTWASHSRLQPFVKLARTVRQYRDGILEYVRNRLNNGRTEGLNGKARTITRRSYGFHSASSLIAMLFLCCGGIHAYPAHTYPFWTH